MRAEGVKISVRSYQERTTKCVPGWPAASPPLVLFPVINKLNKLECPCGKEKIVLR
jgi:hypothetical protein